MSRVKGLKGFMEPENLKDFEQRKKDHISHCLNNHVDVSNNKLQGIALVHEALPDINFSEINISKNILGHMFSSPIYVSSMTAGHSEGKKLNDSFASACEQKNWLFAVGSQRRQLMDDSAANEWKDIKAKHPNLKMLANIGVAQAIECNLDSLESLVTSIDAIGLIIHLNPLQEAIQPEGTTNFKGGLDKIRLISESLSVPVIVKETGCGFSVGTLLKLKSTNIQAVDLSGYGGTHWGRVEGLRAEDRTDINSQMSSIASQTFSNWGESTLSSLMSAISIDPNYSIWASGGVRTGLDVAKFIAMGAGAVGLARPILQAAIKGQAQLISYMNLLEHELKIAMFCTGSESLSQLDGKWKWINKN